jgi:glycosyltransferase involved in cell wall biosynthesis
LARLGGAVAVADVDDLDGAYRRGPLAWLGALSQAPAYLLLKLFSTHHPALRRHLIQEKGIPASKVLKLEQGVDTSVFSPGRPKGALPGELRGKKIILLAAHLNVACEFPLLLRCLKPLLKKREDLAWVVAGGGPLLEKYREQVRLQRLADRVYFTGWLPPPRIRDWMARARVCLALYGKTGANAYRVPMKAGEYLAVGRPLAANALAGLKALEGYAYLSPPIPRSYSRLVQRLLDKKGDGREKAGQLWVRKHLNWDAVCGSFLEQLRHVEPRK